MTALRALALSLLIAVPAARAEWFGCVPANQVYTRAGMYFVRRHFGLTKHYLIPMNAGAEAGLRALFGPDREKIKHLCTMGAPGRGRDYLWIANAYDEADSLYRDYAD